MQLEKDELVNAGGRLQPYRPNAEGEQIKELAVKKDPSSKYQNTGPDLNSLRRWKEVEFDMKTKEWYVCHNGRKI